jgi:alcohol dehydrogenase (cytochrome c)
MKRLIVLLVVTGVAAAWTLTSAAQEPTTRPFVPVSDEMLQRPDAGNWLSWRRTLDGHGFSPLNQINRSNVSGLKSVWTMQMGPGGVQEATPLIYNGIMYVPNPGDLIRAVDAKSGKLLWEHKRQLPPGSRQGGTNRNIAIWGELIIDGSSDNQMYAIDVHTGELVWQTPVFDPKSPTGMGSGPIIANGKVIQGRQCQPGATHNGCVVTAHDARTGKELWRTRTIPRPGEPGNETWGDVPLEERWHVGTWMVPSYDPVLNLVIVGTSVTIPAPKFLLGGNDMEHLYHNSTLAIDADTGRIVWHYQHVVDHWDLDHPFERLLVDTAVAPDSSEVAWINPRIKPGEMRNVVTGVPGKTGIVYTIDRRTGEFLWARPTVRQNVITRIDGATGKAQVNPETLFTGVDQERFVCPSATGGKNFQAGAYNPQINVMFYPLQNLCMNARTTTATRDPARVYGLSMPNQIAPGTENIGTVFAISAETGKTLWKHERRAGMLSLVATGGGLVFGGDTHGKFMAFDERNGDILWEVDLGAPVSGYPVSFAVDGKQYMAVSTGGSLVANSINRLTPEVKVGNTPTLHVFAIP